MAGWIVASLTKNPAGRLPSQCYIHDSGVREPVFDTLSDRLTSVLKNLRGKGRLSDADIDATAREIRVALLEADVALPVVRSFIAGVKDRAKGAEVSQALNPAQQVIKIVNEELVRVLGGEGRRLEYAKNPPTVVMLAGLPGSGKTTLAGHLAPCLAELRQGSGGGGGGFSVGRVCFKKKNRSHT